MLFVPCMLRKRLLCFGTDGLDTYRPYKTKQTDNATDTASDTDNDTDTDT